MEPNPQTIRSAIFKMVKKGYDPDEVDSFKDQVAEAFEAAHNQAIAMEARARAAVAKLHEVSQTASSHEREREREVEGFTASDNDVITRTLALAQRTADLAVSEARAEADAILAQSRDEAERLLDNARVLAAKAVEDSRAEARRAVEGDRMRAENELQSLLARRDFLLSDVDHLEQYLQAQRERLRDAAVGLQELVDRVPAGLGEMRRPLLSASADHADDHAVAEREAQPDSAATSTAPLRQIIDEVDDDDVADVREAKLTSVFDGDDGAVKELSELVWDDESIAAAEQTAELPFRRSAAAPSRPAGGRPQGNMRRSASAPPFNDPLEQDSVWRLLDEEVANSQAGADDFDHDDITTEVPLIPRVADTFRVGGDELQ